MDRSMHLRRWGGKSAVSPEDGGLPLAAPSTSLETALTVQHMNVLELREYIDQVLRYLRADFDFLEQASNLGVKSGTGLYLLNASSGIDFLGSLAVPETELGEKAKKSKGLQGKSAVGSRWYVRTYLGTVRPVYRTAGVDDLLYRALRCGQVHEGIVNRGVLIGVKREHAVSHLMMLRPYETEDEMGFHRELVYVNTRVLASDFIQSTFGFAKDMETDDGFAARMAIRLSHQLRKTGDACQGLNLAGIDLNSENFEDFYQGSSGSPALSLKACFWEEA